MSSVAATADRVLEMRVERVVIGAATPLRDVALAVSRGEIVGVAGHVGAEQRFEYTVIGDPVNQAARLSELAKGRTERVLASGEAVGRAGDAESARWEPGEPVELRGRGEPTGVATPRPGSLAAS